MNFQYFVKHIHLLETSEDVIAFAEQSASDWLGGVPVVWSGDQLSLPETAHSVGQPDLLMLASQHVVIALNHIQSHLESLSVLVQTLGQRDLATGLHTRRVAELCQRLGRTLRLGSRDLQHLQLAALLHDFGKIGVDDQILRKTAELAPEEWVSMRQHPELGSNLLGRMRGLSPVLEGVRFHHERWDGKGYPLGLKGDEIPFLARVIAVVDSFDAMVSDRPYRKALGVEEALAEICRQKGHQFDPAIVSAFLECMSGCQATEGLLSFDALHGMV